MRPPDEYSGRTNRLSKAPEVFQPGEYVFLGAEQAAAGRLAAAPGRILMSKDGVRPPM